MTDQIERVVNDWLNDHRPYSYVDTDDMEAVILDGDFNIETLIAAIAAATGKAIEHKKSPAPGADK